MAILSFTFIKAEDNFFSKGYRGFVDLGYTIGVGDYKFGRIEIIQPMDFRLILISLWEVVSVFTLCRNELMVHQTYPWMKEK